jgi:uncharacterized protein
LLITGFGIAVAGAFFGYAFAAPLEDGDIFSGCRDYKAALQEWLPLAEKGDAAAQVRVGRLYDFGFGVTQSYTAAGNWYRKAAEQGNAGAEFLLGVLYDFGYGVQQDYTLAVQW